MTNTNEPVLDAPDPGAVLVPAEIGVPFGGWVSMTMPDVMRWWRPDDLERFRQFAGHGVLTRTMRAPRLWREIVHVDKTTGDVYVSQTPDLREPGRHRTVRWTGQWSSGRPKHRSNALPGLKQWFSSVYLRTVKREEVLVVHIGGRQLREHPYVMASGVPGERGPNIRIDAAPTPPAGKGWTFSEDRTHHAIEAPVDQSTLATVGELIVAATDAWSCTPIDLVVTFARGRTS